MARAMPSAVQPLPLEVGVPAGRVVVRQGEPCPHPVVVAQGALYVSTVDDQGRVLGLDVTGPGDIVGEPAGASARATARALGPCRLAPARDRHLAALLDVREQRLASLAFQLAWLDVAGRVQHRLRDLATRFGRPVPGGTLVALGLTQEELAQLCGTSRETANRVLRALVAHGRLRLIGRGRFIVPPAQGSGASPASARAGGPAACRRLPATSPRCRYRSSAPCPSRACRTDRTCAESQPTRSWRAPPLLRGTALALQLQEWANTDGPPARAPRGVVRVDRRDHLGHGHGPASMAANTCASRSARWSRYSCSFAWARSTTGPCPG